MAVVLDDERLVMEGAEGKIGAGTIGEFLAWARGRVGAGRVVVKIEVGQRVLEGAGLAAARHEPLGAATLRVTTADRKELSLRMLGKLAALVEWLMPQHGEVAGMLERGETQAGLKRLGGILAAWQEIQGAYGNLAKMLELQMKDLRVRDVNGEVVLAEFCRQLEEIQTALESRDFVLLADILQYETEGAGANWMALLAATLGEVEQ